MFLGCTEFRQSIYSRYAQGVSRKMNRQIEKAKENYERLSGSQKHLQKSYSQTLPLIRNSYEDRMHTAAGTPRHDVMPQLACAVPFLGFLQVLECALVIEFTVLC